jgi:hypothetical protein
MILYIQHHHTCFVIGLIRMAPVSLSCRNASAARMNVSRRRDDRSFVPGERLSVFWKGQPLKITMFMEMAGWQLSGQVLRIDAKINLFGTQGQSQETNARPGLLKIGNRSPGE